MTACERWGVRRAAVALGVLAAPLTGCHAWAEQGDCPDLPMEVPEGSYPLNPESDPPFDQGRVTIEGDRLTLEVTTDTGTEVVVYRVVR